MSTPTNITELTPGVPTPADHSQWLVRPELPSTEETTVRQLAVVTERRSGPQFFALVDARDPDQVYYYGIDVGTGAFTVRRDPASHQTDFGSWLSMRSAFERLDGMAGGPGRLALVVFDSVPAAAVRTIGGHGELAPAVASTGELEHQAEWDWHGFMMGSVERGEAV